jgi:hypothetical protein
MAIERGAPVGRIALSLLRRLTDRDHDGASALFGGGGPENGREILLEIIADANAPNVLPKLISDPAYGLFMLVHAGLTGTDIFKLQAAGIKTLTEGTIGVSGQAISRVLGAAKGLGGGSQEEGYSEAQVAQIAQLLKMGSAASASTENTVG